LCIFKITVLRLPSGQLRMACVGEIMTNSKTVINSIIVGVLFILGLQGCERPKSPEPKKSASAMSRENRLARYSTASNRLACLSDMQLNDLLKTATQLSVGYGENVALSVDGVPVFIKKVPLTDLELKPENIRSTANIFNLPTFYQYGIGSAGFGAWRELAANVMITNWVLTGQCENFPIMYHFRVLPGIMPKIDEVEQKADLEESVKFWDNSPAVRTRLQALTDSSHFVIIFLENIPTRLNVWLDEQFTKGTDAVDTAALMIEKNLEATTKFMAAHGMYHFDAHFSNIMTDGCRLYFADMGLATSIYFDLSPEEITFVSQHKTYDQFYTRANFAGELIQRLVKSREEFKTMIAEYGRGKQDMIFSPIVTSMLKKYAPSSVIRDEFYNQLFKISKSSPYPAQAIEALDAVSIAKNK